MQKYKTCFIMGVQKAIEYRFDFFVGYFSAIFPIIIQVSMWSAIYSSTKTGILYGYSYQQMILYTFFVGIVSRFLSTGFEYEMNDDIKNGGLNKYIVKPVNYCFYRGGCFLGERSSISIVFFVILIVLCAIFRVIGFFQIDLLKIICFLMALMFSLLLNFFLYFCIGMSGFWFSEISRVFPAIGVIFTVISGGIFPLDILGENFNQFISLLPFKYLLQFPVDIIVGKQLHYDIILGFIIQVFWIFVLGFCTQILWKKGLQKYIAVGG